MFEVALSELHHNSVLTKWGWTAWMFLHVMVSGTRSLVTVHQPPVISAALGGDAIMPCQLDLSHSEKMVNSPVLYWEHSTQVANNSRLWTPSEKYEGRVRLLDENPNSSNKSLLLKSVQWEDTGRYLCKVTVTTEKECLRMRGNETLLMIYDAMIFNLTGRNGALLRCEVNVTRGPGFVFSIFHDGLKPQTVDSAPGAAALDPPTHVTLSETVPLRGGGKYECQLHLNGDLIAKSIIHYPAPVAGGGGGAGEIVLTPCPTVVSESGVVEFPEPWLLYVLHLLVPFAFLLGLVIALLSRC